MADDLDCILWHNASIYDIVRALGEDWAMRHDGQMLKTYMHAFLSFDPSNDDKNYPHLDPSKSAYDQDPAKIEEIIKLFN